MAMQSFSEQSSERNKLAQYRYLRAKSYEKTYDYERALRQYRRALLLTPENNDIRYSYAKLLNLMGASFSFMNQLQLVVNNLGDTQPRINEELDMWQHKDLPSVVKEWKTQQGYLGDPIHIMVSRLGITDVDQFGFDERLQSEFIGYLENFSRLSVKNLSKQPTLNALWQQARADGMDFFMVLRTRLDDRKFYAAYDLYLTSTGVLLQSFAVERSTLDKIDDVFAQISQQIHRILPMRAKILRRKDNNVLITLGKMHGVKVDDQFVVIKAGKSSLVSHPPYYSYNASDYLGDVIVSNIDEFISDGQLTVTKHPDLVTQEDLVFLVQKDLKMPKFVEYQQEIPKGFFVIH
jgi:hypothetical protein